MGSDYPANEKQIRADIQDGHMYVGRIDGRIASVFILNDKSDEEYISGAWKFPDLPYLVVHRLCVHPLFGGCGVGKETMREIERMCLSEGVEAIRLDAFSQNPVSLGMYESLGFEQVGSARWRMGIFWLYEKRLQ